MNKDQVEGKWKEFSGKVKEKWGQLTDDELTEAEGNMDQLAGKIQQKYGGTKEDIRRELDDYDKR
jgi:uncharacterized protein YjbJ (UPF0337 family)